MVKKLCEQYKINETVRFDSYLIRYILKYDENVKGEIDDWEDSDCYNIEKYKEKLELLKSEKVDSTRFVLVEGFLIYSRQDISDILDYKIYLEVDKEVARFPGA